MSLIFHLTTESAGAPDRPHSGAAQFADQQRVFNREAKATLAKQKRKTCECGGDTDCGCGKMAHKRPTPSAEANTASSNAWLLKEKGAKKKFKPFKAKGRPHKDFRGEKTVNGTLWRV